MFPSMQDDHLVVAERSEPQLSREQKAGLFFVILCGLGALVFGVQYVWAHMAKPFTVNYTGPRLLTGAEKESAETAAQKAADTDGDTVSDYDELYVFKTSPYLADSDSDGLSDSNEITSGQDPNCTLGKECGDVKETVVPGNSAGFVTEDQAAIAAEAARLQAGLDSLKNLDVAEIRSTLINAGANPDEINGLSDAEVQTLYDQLIAELESSGALQNVTSQILEGTMPTP